MIHNPTGHDLSKEQWEVVADAKASLHSSVILSKTIGNCQGKLSSEVMRFPAKHLILYARFRFFITLLRLAMLGSAAAHNAIMPA